MRTIDPAGGARQRLRHGLACAAATTATMLASVVAAPAAVAGQPVTTISDSVHVECEGSAGAHGAQLALDENEGAVRVLAVVLADDGSAVLHNPEGSGEVTPDGLAFSGTMPLLDAAEELVGTGSFTVTMREHGAATTRNASHRIGNVRETSTLTEQPLVGEAVLTLPDGTVAELTCTGRADRWSITLTQPDAYADRGPRILNIDCAVPLPDGSVGVLFVEHRDGAGYLSVSLSDEHHGIGGETDDFVTTRQSLSATVPVHERGAEEPAGTATVDLALSSLDRSRYVLRQSVGKQTFFVEVIGVVGSVSMPDGRVVAFDCEGERSTSQEVSTAPTGPGATGPVPVHDAVAGAIALAPGDRHSAHTRAATAAPEAPLWCYSEPPEDPGFLPGRTVWYRFTGTGGPMTIDTAGSGFNTTLAVYAVLADEYTEVACADDHFRDTEQARATVDTHAGVDYLVQVGGIGGQSGLLKIALDPRA